MRDETKSACVSSLHLIEPMTCIPKEGAPFRPFNKVNKLDYQQQLNDSQIQMEKIDEKRKEIHETAMRLEIQNQVYQDLIKKTIANMEKRKRDFPH